MAATTVSLRLLIDSKSRRVLFAEADKDFVDFLFNILSLSVGTVTRLLTEKGMVGSLGNLSGSIENLGDTYMQSAATKDILLKPMLWSCNNVANDPEFICPDCGNVMDQNVDLVNVTSKGSPSVEGGYVKGDITCMVMDDLVVKPISTISSITLLNMFKVQDVAEGIVAVQVDPYRCIPWERRN
ncbi:hypothetical protein V6N12_002097 [Hibiscus sabdariffa]|uniref:DUF674 domain-containing protein n=1 Tax=Hibiscus sabdariffa TaxID=183260 RepID=A0ABR2APM3_9ROSI